MEGDLIKINEWLLPVAWLYGIGVRIRNELFEMGILKSKSYDIPVISVGNITVGGTGKTPHTEYLIRLFEENRACAGVPPAAVRAALQAAGKRLGQPGAELTVNLAEILLDDSVTFSL